MNLRNFTARIEITTDGVTWTQDGSDMPATNQSQGAAPMARQLAEWWPVYLDDDDYVDVIDWRVRVWEWPKQPDVSEPDAVFYPELKQVVTDPDRSFGQPILDRTGVRVSVVVGMFLAGESIAVVAEEFGLTVEEVEVCLRYVLAHPS